MENVKLVSATCPKCAAKLQLPDDLKKAHCIYCGNEFIVSEDKPDVHYHLGERIGTIENYVKLAIESIIAGDMARAKDYFHKAKEINIEQAQKLIDDKSDEIAQAYLNLSLMESKRVYDAPLYECSMYVDNTSVIDLYRQNSDIAWKNGVSFITSGNNKLMSRAMVIAAKIKIPLKEGPYKYNTGMVDAINVDSKTCLRNALKYDPDNKDAISMLIELGERCESCDGSGVCYSCDGTGTCSECSGKGICSKCDGTGQVSGWFGKEKICKACNGKKICPSCHGVKICPGCKGKKKCLECHGRGL